jgi:hypothetical protein
MDRIMYLSVLIFMLFIVSYVDALNYPRRFTISFDWNEVRTLDEGAKLVLENGFRAYLTEVSPGILISQPNPSIDALDYARSQQSEFLVVLKFTENMQFEIFSDIYLYNVASGILIQRLSIEPVIPDVRRRNLGKHYYEDLSSFLNPYLEERSNLVTIKLIGKPGTQVNGSFISGIIPDEGFFYWQGEGGQTDTLHCSLQYHFDLKINVYIPQSRSETIREIVLIPEKYNEKFLIETGLQWISYPSISAWYGVVPEHFYVGGRFGYYVFGLHIPEPPFPSTSALALDRHLAELGPGILWYPFTRTKGAAMHIGLDFLLRFDLASYFWLDIVNPFVLQSRIGAELEVYKGVRFCADVVQRIYYSEYSHVPWSSRVSPENWAQQAPDPSPGIMLQYGPWSLQALVPFIGVRIQP